MSRPAAAASPYDSFRYTDYSFTYATDEANNLITLRSQAGIGYNLDNQVSSAIANTSLGFDDDGNTRTYNNVPGYTFDVENRISGYGGAPVLSCNPDGLRGMDSTSGSPVFYFYDGGQLQNETDAAGSVTRSFPIHKAPLPAGSGFFCRKAFLRYWQPTPPVSWAAFAGPSAGPSQRSRTDTPVHTNPASPQPALSSRPP